jgi:hypothetical protein
MGTHYISKESDSKELSYESYGNPTKVERWRGICQISASGWDYSEGN